MWRSGALDLFCIDISLLIPSFPIMQQIFSSCLSAEMFKYENNKIEFQSNKNIDRFFFKLKTLFFDSLISLYNSPLSFNNLSAVLNNYAIP